MALSANANYPALGAGVEFSAQVANAAVLYAEGIAAIGTKYHGTSDVIGRTTPWNAAQHTLPIGLMQAGHGPVTGSSSASVVDLSTGDRRKAPLAIHRGQVFRLPVTSAAGTNADMGREVFASDDGTFAFARSTRNVLIGTVCAVSDAGYAWVRLLLGDDQILLSKMGQGRFLLTMMCSLVTATAVAVTTTPGTGAYKVISGIARIIVKTDGSAGAITLQLKNGTTAFTSPGGAFSIQAAGADAINAEIAASTILDDGTNYIREGDDLRVALTQAGTTATAGIVAIQLLCEYQLGF